MRIAAVAFACVGLIGTLTFAEAAPEQRVVSFSVEGLKIVGTLELPEAVKNAPVVLLLHGFTGKRDELAIPSANNQGIFARAADAWAKAGFASLRIDFRGSGDSEGSYADTTISDEIKEALAATDFLQNEKDVDASRLYVVGWSQGGTVATAVAGRSAHPIKAVALWAPAYGKSAPFVRPGRARRCSSSVVEHSLGKGEVESSILSCSTSSAREIKDKLPKRAFIVRNRASNRAEA